MLRALRPSHDAVLALVDRLPESRVGVSSYGPDSGTARTTLVGSYGEVNPGTDGLSARTDTVPRRPAMVNDMCSCAVSAKPVP